MSCNCHRKPAPRLVSGSEFFHSRKSPFRFCPHRCDGGGHGAEEDCELSSSSSSSSSSGSSSSSSSCEYEREEADFVVVGMGAGGATVLRLLSDAGFSVIGIEAGGNHDDDPLILSSPNAPNLEEEYGYKFFYQQETAPNPDANGLVDNYTTGRMWGGGTSINGMQYVRSTDGVWQQWAAINGPAWSPQAVTDAYKALEKFDGVNGKFTPANHGADGKMQIRQAPVVETSMAVKLANALQNIHSSFNQINDYNDPATPIGTFTRWSLFQQPNGDRASSSTDFLADILDTDGNSRSRERVVKLLQNATVARVLFDRKNRARAVEIIQNGLTNIVRARKEIILCAGIHSNEILQRSGIGHAPSLEALRIPVVYDNHNVGAHSRNHLINYALFSANPLDVGVPANDPSALYVGGAFLPLPGEEAQNKRGFQWIGINPAPDKLMVAFYNLDAKSEGTDRLQDKDPLRVSVVEEKLLSDATDLDRIVSVFQKQVKKLDENFNSLYPGYALLDPPVSLLDPSKTEDLKEYIKGQLSHTHHFQGTCRMAPASDNGVVGSDGGVHGVKRLRVADISVAPVTTDGNTAGPAFVVAYIIAQQIIAKYK